MASGKSKKAGLDQVKTVRIAVVGPSFCGKTQIVNRIVNNHFYPQYIPTVELETYKMFHNRALMGVKPDFVMIEIMDCFPQDHPYLFDDPQSAETDDIRVMQDDLKKLIENKPLEDGKKKWIDAYIFVYNSADKHSFKKLMRIIKSVHEFEESHAKGKTDSDGSAHVKKYILGTKKDLKPPKKTLDDDDLASLQQYDAGGKTIYIDEVSALSAYGVKEIFEKILEEVVSVAGSGKQNQQDDNQSASNSDGSEGADDDSEEETKQEQTTGGGNGKKPVAEYKQNIDYMSQQLNNQQAKKRRDGGGDPDAGAKPAGKSKTKGNRNAEAAAEEEGGMLKSYLPFLYAADNAGQTKGRR